MCGTAGRILLELGFHNGDVLDEVLHSDGERKAVCVMMASIIILDRQWSAMTGLPANFPDPTFNPTPTYLVSNSVCQYLRKVKSWLIRRLHVPMCIG
jgi:hypothetical protein